MNSIWTTVLLRGRLAESTRRRMFHYPGIGEGAFILLPVSLGIAMAALTEFRRLTQEKTPFMSATSLRDRPVAQATLGRAEGILRSAHSFFYETLTRVWERTLAGVASSQEEKANLLLAAVHAVRSSVEAVDLVYGLAGTTGIYKRSPLERYFRDVHTLRHHGFVSESRYPTYGQVTFGVEQTMERLRVFHARCRITGIPTETVCFDLSQSEGQTLYHRNTPSRPSRSL